MRSLFERSWQIAPALFCLFLLTALPVAVQAAMSIDLRADENNPAAPVMGDRLQFRSTISNTGPIPVNGMVAWISLVQIDPGNEQPVDLEDWSAHKAVSGASLGPGQSLQTEWPMRLIKGGDYRVVINVTDREGQRVYTSPTVQFHVRQKQVLQAGRVLAVAGTIPLVFIGLMLFQQIGKRTHWKRHF